MVTSKKNTRRKYVEIPPEKLAILKTHSWCVYTNDEVTRRAIAEYINNIGNVSMGEGKITTKQGKDLPVFFINWIAVDWLRTNRNQVPYSFTLYHKIPRRYDWMEWREGKKGPSETAKKNFANSSELRFEQGRNVKGLVMRPDGKV